MKTELKAFLKNRAKQLESDFNDVPEWVIEATADFVKNQIPITTQLDKAFEKAGEYLCEGDINTPHQLSNIVNHKDQSDLIDNVEGVVVWEKVELEFTCKEFLELIGYPKKD
jgi:hypothetical protein